MNAQFLVVCSALLLFAQAVYAADGKYQHTKDRKTLVWNSDPKPGDISTWSGDRDKERYATGYGILTWYQTKQTSLTGSVIPSTKLQVFARYSGNMVLGKFDGPVNVEANGKVAHATFTDGKRTGAWSPGRAPARAVAEQRAEAVRKEPHVEPEPPAAGPSPSPTSALLRDGHVRRDVAQPPAEGPPPVQRSEIKSQGAEITDQHPKQHVSEPAVRETPSPAMDDSLRSLAAPDFGLQTNVPSTAPPQPSATAPTIASSPIEVVKPPTAPSPPAGPHLAAEEVTALADAEARAKGYDLREYQRGEAQYAAGDNMWSILYDQEAVDRNGMSKSRKPFRVRVEDKTKKTSIVSGQ